MRKCLQSALAFVVVFSAGVASAQTFAYITYGANDVVEVYDTSTNPRGIAIAPNGAFACVVNNSSGTTSVIDTAMNTVNSLP